MATVTTSVSRAGAASASSVRAFLAICWRDVFVEVGRLPIFLAQMLLQPIFLVFIFGRILPSLGYATSSFASLLLPGIVALTIVTTALQSTALPLVLEFSFTKEIEDRLLAPLPVAWVGIQKIVIASLRGLIAGVVIFPLGAWIIGNVLHLSTDYIGLVVLFCILGALIGSCIGLTLGTSVEPSQINIMFALILTPLLFTGCTQYPWALLDRIKWYQVVTLFNPITYVSEGMRAALVPSVPHMNTAIAVAVLCVAVLAFGALGVRGFVRRAID